MAKEKDKIIMDFIQTMATYYYERRDDTPYYLINRFKGIMDDVDEWAEENLED